MDEETEASNASNLQGIEDVVRKAVEDYLNSQESRIYAAILGEVTRHLPDPAQPLRELAETMSSTLKDLGVTASASEIATQIGSVMPKEIVKPLVDLYGVVSPRLEWAMSEILNNSKPVVDQLRAAILAPIEARVREIFHAAFTAVVRKVAQQVGRLADAAMAKLMEALKAILMRILEAAMIALRKIIEMAVRALIELVDKIGRFVLKTAKAVAMWLARKIAMFVIKMVLKVISLLFGFPGGYFDAAWMETEAQIRI
jgi:hypothetical protein